MQDDDDYGFIAFLGGTLRSLTHRRVREHENAALGLTSSAFCWSVFPCSMPLVYQALGVTQPDDDDDEDCSDNRFSTPPHNQQPTIVQEIPREVVASQSVAGVIAQTFLEEAQSTDVQSSPNSTDRGYARLRDRPMTTYGSC